MMQLATLTTLFGIINVHLASGFSFENLDTLLKDKLSTYNRKIRPVHNQSTTTMVYLNFDLITLQELDEVNDRFSVIGIIYLYWEDQMMTWDPEKYGDLKEILTESGDFWTPHFVLVNTYEKLEKVGDDWTLIRYNPEGVASYTPGQIFAGNCQVDIFYYPWDTQTCSLTFSPFGYVNTEIAFTAIEDHVLLNYYSPNGLWDLVNTSSTVHYSGHTVVSVISFTLKRKPQFTIVNIIIPIVIMSLLNIVVFFIPTESGERISYCLTVLLSIAVFLTLVGDNLPKTSNPMAILSYYLVFILALSVCVTFSTIFSLRLYFHDDDDVPSFLLCVVKFTRCGCRSSRSKTRQGIGYDNRFTMMENEDMLSQHDDNGRQIYIGHGQFRNIKPVNYTIPLSNYKSSENGSIQKQNGYNDRHLGNNDMGINKAYTEETKQTMQPGNDNDQSPITWKHVSIAFDKLFLVLYTLVLIAATTVFGLIATQKI